MIPIVQMNQTEVVSESYYFYFRVDERTVIEDDSIFMDIMNNCSLRIGTPGGGRWYGPK